MIMFENTCAVSIQYCVYSTVEQYWVSRTSSNTNTIHTTKTTTPTQFQYQYNTNLNIQYWYIKIDSLYAQSLRELRNGDEDYNDFPIQLNFCVFCYKNISPSK